MPPFLFHVNRLAGTSGPVELENVCFINHFQQARVPILSAAQVNLIPERNIPVNFVPGEAGGTGGIRKKTPPGEENRLEQDIRAILNRS